MRRSMPRVHKWSEAGNDLYKTGTIQHESHPVHLWLIDRWLQNAEHLVSHGAIGRVLDPIWRRVTPGHGDPVCFAYLYGWSSWYDNLPQRRDEALYEVGFDNLSAEYRDWYRKDGYSGSEN